MILKFLLVAGLFISSVTIVEAEAQGDKSIAEIQEMLKVLKTTAEVATTLPNPLEYLDQAQKMKLASREAERQRIKTLASDSGLNEECLFRQESIALHTYEIGKEFGREARDVRQQISRLFENMPKLPESIRKQIATSIAELEMLLTELNKKERDTYRQAEQLKSAAFTECLINAE